MVAISGCTSSAGNKTYTYGSLSLSAPDNMQNATSTGSIISGSDTWVDVGSLVNSDDINIFIQKSTTNVDPQLSSTASAQQIKENNGTLLSTTHGTNPNGLLIYETITTITSPSSGDNLKYYDMTFKGKEGITYGLSIFSKSSNTNLKNVRDMVYNSLKA
jgi:hypothetical protein